MDLDQILKQLQSGDLDIDEAKRRLQERFSQPVEDLGFAQLDIEREKRTGFPEVIYGSSKTPEQIIAIFKKLMQHIDKVIATRIDRSKAEAILPAIPEATYHEIAGLVTWFKKPIVKVNQGYVAVVCAGTSDLPVAEEAAIICEAMGNHVERVYDVGVAGIHRLFKKLPLIKGANAIVVVAGMEGALASVVGGLVSKPVVAVPTSVGYGAHFQGMSALLSMLNACAPGISVVNIDNGFGGGYYAGLINKMKSERL